MSYIDNGITPMDPSNGSGDNGAHPWEAEMDYHLQSLNDRIEACWAQTLKERDERHRAEMESLTKGFETRLSVVHDGPPHWADGNATPRRGSGENTKPRVAKPKPFNGKSENVETFFHQLFLVFRDQPHQYETDDAKILLALSYMSEGQAAKWASSITGHLERGVFPYETYEAFREDVKKSFLTGSDTDKAQYKLEVLRQGDGSAAAYFVNFEEFKNDTGYNEAGLIRLLKNGLNQSLVRPMYKMEEVPITYAAWKRYAIRFDTNHMDYKSLKSENTRSTPIAWSKRISKSLGRSC